MTRSIRSIPPATGIAGERRARQLLMGFAIATALALSGSFIYLWLYKPAGIHLYFELQRRAALIYIASWALVALLAAIAACARRTLYFSYCLTLALCLEGASHLYFYLANGMIYHPPSSLVIHQFDPHPLLVGIPHPNNFGGVSHDSQHRRTTVNEGKIANPKRIFVFGGSSTYDIVNADAQTWTSDLSRTLGANYEVQNYGVPGYASVEGLIQTLFTFRDSKPVCAIYYEGWNDLRYSHITNLKADYSDYHFPGQVHVLGLGHQPGALENNVLFFRLVVSLFVSDPNPYPSGDQGAISGQKDPRLSKIYMDNMTLIGEIARHFGVKPLFVPQILNYAPSRLAHNWPWMPFIRGRDVPHLMQEMNKDLEQAAHDSGAGFIGSPLAVTWTEADFFDEGHFTIAGAEKFARAIAGDVAANCR